MFRYFKAVVWSFLGLREKHAFETDHKKLKPIVLIVVGILICIVFIVVLIGVIICKKCAFYPLLENIIPNTIYETVAPRRERTAIK